MRFLGEILRETFGVTEESIEGALTVQREKGGPLGGILIQQRKITEKICSTLAVCSAAWLS